MKQYCIYLLVLFMMAGCGNAPADDTGTDNATHHETAPPAGEMELVHLSRLQFNSLGMEVDTLPQRALSGLVEASGQLEVPPQHEAAVTAVLGANIQSIKVMEGDKVHKGQVLAYLAHPDITLLQTNYLKAVHQLEFLQKEKDRQQRLYEEKVGAGKTYQQTLADYRTMEAEVRGYEMRFRQLHLDASKIKTGHLYEAIPAVSPIEGFIEKVQVKPGQYVQPQTALFQVVNNDHIHADLMVFENDVYRIRKGQQISFTIAAVPGVTLKAAIYSIGKQFEQDPKAVHVHADIEDKKDFMIPGMYIHGKIHTTAAMVPALPEAAIMEEEGKQYLFTARQEGEEWQFSPVEIRTGLTEDGWVEVKLLAPLEPGTRVALNNAYYLVAEMKKGTASHDH